jgi:hypothetical protein
VVSTGIIYAEFMAALKKARRLFASHRTLSGRDSDDIVSDIDYAMSLDKERYAMETFDTRHPSFGRVLANQQLIISMLRVVLAEENIMAIDLTAITAEVANNATVSGSVVQLVQNLAAQIAAIPPSTDPTTQAALEALTATLGSNDTAIAAVVTANTPAAVPPASGRR